MASSFGATNIRVELDPNSGARPQWERQAYATTRHVPGGNTDVTQVVGYGSQTIVLRLLLTTAEWTALQAQLLAQATLTLAGSSQGTCLLEALAGPQEAVQGYVSVAATFRRAG